MRGFWIRLEGGIGGYCEGRDEYDAKQIAAHISGRKVLEVKSLPYPASPVIWQFDHPVLGKMPTFCFSPTKCAGHTSCPQRHSCTE
jgi:hypothetical protein